MESNNEFDLLRASLQLEPKFSFYISKNNVDRVSNKRFQNKRFKFKNKQNLLILAKHLKSQAKTCPQL